MRLIDSEVYITELLTRLRDDLSHEHCCGTMYEDEEHDPFDNKNGGKANNGYNWEGNKCDVCALLLETDVVVAEAGGQSAQKTG